MKINHSFSSKKCHVKKFFKIYHETKTFDYVSQQISVSVSQFKVNKYQINMIL